MNHPLPLRYHTSRTARYEPVSRSDAAKPHGSDAAKPHVADERPEETEVR